MSYLLLIDDCDEVHRLVEKSLGSEHRVAVRGSLHAALRFLETETPELVLLDVGLPDGDGYEICSILQSQERTRRIPIVFLTARGEARDRILAFRLGAEDYLEKPFDLLELRVRVASRLEKRGLGQSPLRCGPLCIDLSRFRATRMDGGSESVLDLTPSEFKLLHELVRCEGRVLSREQIRSSIWGDVVVAPRTIDAHVSNLRKKLGPAAVHLESVRGLGYRFCRAAEAASI